MKREQFLRALRKELGVLPRSERERVLQYYDEMISDGVESGETESAVVSSLGAPRVVADQILAERAESDGGRREKKSSRGVWLAATAILWIPLALALVITGIGLLIVVAALWVSAFAVAAAMFAVFLAGGISFFLMLSNLPTALAQLATAFLALSLGCLICFVCIKLTRPFLWLMRASFRFVKGLFVPKGGRHVEA